jgi:hypothetical protein
MDQHNQVIAQPLTHEEKRFLFEQRNSEHWRVFDKAITYMYGVTASIEMMRATTETLPQIQGRLMGLLMAKNLLSQGIPEEKKKPERKPAHRGKQFEEL